MSNPVKMTRTEPLHDGGPVTADVHTDEVENWTAAGWRVAEQQEPEAPKRGRKPKAGVSDGGDD